MSLWWVFGAHWLELAKKQNVPDKRLWKITRKRTLHVEIVDGRGTKICAAEDQRRYMRRLAGLSVRRSNRSSTPRRERLTRLRQGYISILDVNTIFHEAQDVMFARMDSTKMEPNSTERKFANAILREYIAIN